MVKCRNAGSKLVPGEERSWACPTPQQALAFDLATTADTPQAKLGNKTKSHSPLLYS